MAFLRQYVFPFLIVAMFLIALIPVSARIFLPTDLAAPAPTGEVTSQTEQSQVFEAETVANQPGAILPGSN